jgi:hypothetical protein
MNYKQCVLNKTISPFAQMKKIGWIPENFAQVGKTLKLKDHKGKWDNHWTVEEVYDILHDEQFILDHEREFQYWKQVLDE